MELKLDISRTYAIALEGGGAKGGYEIGVWRALEEAGVRYNAVSGTSVGALNGALMAMRDLPRAEAAWNDMRLSKVVELDEEQEENLSRAFGGEIELDAARELIPEAWEIIKNRGLDVAPLRAWVREVVDAGRVKSSDVELFIATVSLTDRKALELKVNDLPENEICDMLLASAYHPTFRLEKLGGKFYTDGGVVDTLPLHALVTHGYKDIIAVRIPGMGHERRFKMPEDVSVTYIAPEFDLGGVLNFDAQQSRRDMTIGYLDAKRVLYGLAGRQYYIERTMSEREALSLLCDCKSGKGTLRDYIERELPRIARKLVCDGDYYALMLAVAESAAAERDIDHLRIYTDREFLQLLSEADK